jgi:hypothetical protein
VTLLVPVCVSNVCDDGDEHWECNAFVCLEDGEEVIVLEEAHRAIGDLVQW